MSAYIKRITAGYGLRAAALSNWLDSPSTVTPVYGADQDAWETALHDLKHQTVNIKADYGLNGALGANDQPGLQAAVDDAVAGSRKVLHLPYGQYRLDAPLNLTGASPLAIIGSTAPDSSSSLYRNFDGNLINLRTSLMMHNVILIDSGASTSRSGAAISMAASTSQRAQYCLFDHVRITSAAAGGAWEWLINTDGTAYTGDSNGIRDLQFRGCYFFGVRTAKDGENIRVDRGTNWFFHTCHMSASPVTGHRAGIKILDGTNSDTFLFANCDWGADIESEAAGTYFVGKMIFTNAPVLTGASSHVITHQGYHFGNTADGATGIAIAIRESGGAGDRLRIRNDGTVFLGDGTASPDASISRSAAATLRAETNFHVGGAFRHLGATAGFYNAAAVAKPTVTGSRGANAALASLLTALASQGLLVDSSS